MIMAIVLKKYEKILRAVKVHCEFVCLRCGLGFTVNVASPENESDR